VFAFDRGAAAVRGNHRAPEQGVEVEPGECPRVGAHSQVAVRQAEGADGWNAGGREAGLRAAAHYWFDESPRELSTRQAAFLAALTSEPTSMARRVRRAGMLDPDSAERVGTILRAMKRDGVISTEQYDTAKQQGMGFATAALRHE